jgi:hypothetical protein
LPRWHHHDRTDDYRRADYDYGSPDDNRRADLAEDNDERTDDNDQRTDEDDESTDDDDELADDDGGTRRQHYCSADDHAAACAITARAITADAVTAGSRPDTGSFRPRRHCGDRGAGWAGRRRRDLRDVWVAAPTAV